MFKQPHEALTIFGAHHQIKVFHRPQPHRRIDMAEQRGSFEGHDFYFFRAQNIFQVFQSLKLNDVLGS